VKRAPRVRLFRCRSLLRIPAFTPYSWSDPKPTAPPRAHRYAGCGHIVLGPQYPCLLISIA
jgi:hypothetical protein